MHTETASVTSFSAAGPQVQKRIATYLWQDMNYGHFKHAMKEITHI